MRIQPRQQILDVWRALVDACWDAKSWRWDGVMPANSISDSEQLLCLLYPATEIETFALDEPDRMEEDVVSVLGGKLGDPKQIGTFIVSLLEEYIEHNTREDGQPNFSAGSYLRSGEKREPTEEQRKIEVVDSYSMSLTVCMAGLRFLRSFERTARGRLKDRIEELSGQLSTRLTAAMTGLVRSFVVNTVRPKSPEGQAMLGMLNQTGMSEDALLQGVRSSLSRVRARLRSDVTLGQEETVKELEDENLLFECGWSWGIARDASPVKFVTENIGGQTGIADPRPYLYFTIVALDGINDLVSPRTGELGLLDETQHRLAQALRTRWELTQRYWSTIARFGSGSWPLEDIPWRTSDGEQSDYFSLIVSAVLIQDLVARTASDDDLTRAVAIFDELAGRGRIIRRAAGDDPAVQLHTPGVRLTLRGSEVVDSGPVLQWEVSDFSAVLLKRMLQAARLSNNVAARDKLMELSKSAMEHLDRRMLRAGAAGLWDDPAGVFGVNGDPTVTEPSWYMTERVVECLVAADRTYREPPPNWTELQTVARVTLNTAEHRFHQEMLGISIDDKSPRRKTLNRVEEHIDEARQQIREDAATTLVHTLDALRELDGLATGRRDATRNV
ncbi:SCO2524 family protein [Nocardia sp. NPDC005998]|uniref:SCO2524 family protein n=1 Tax=Nocardia sp. NPDC005998 TaxID=3156894 RepID=UPI0033A6110C